MCGSHAVRPTHLQYSRASRRRRQGETLSSPALAQRFRGEGKLHALSLHEVLEQGIELAAILHRNHRHSIGGLNSVRIAIASDDFGAHNVERGFHDAIIEHPAWKLQACGRTLCGSLQIAEGYAITIRPIAFQNVTARADHRRGAIPPA